MRSGGACGKGTLGAPSAGTGMRLDESARAGTGLSADSLFLTRRGLFPLSRSLLEELPIDCLNLMALVFGKGSPDSDRASNSDEELASESLKALLDRQLAPG